VTRLSIMLTIAAVLAGAAPAPASAQQQGAPLDQGNGNWDPPRRSALLAPPDRSALWRAAKPPKADSVGEECLQARTSVPSVADLSVKKFRTAHAISQS
jgi:hypothetical protein